MNINGNPLIIGVSGKATSGKDYVSNLLITELRDTSIIKLSLADSLKEELAKELDISLDHLYNQNKYQYRERLISYGKEERSKNINIWIEKLVEKFNKNPTEILIIPDIRFPNEAEFIRAHKGLIIRIQRPVELIDDLSETSLDDYKFDCIIDNTTQPDLTELIKLINDSRNNTP